MIVAALSQHRHNRFAPRMLATLLAVLLVSRIARSAVDLPRPVALSGTAAPAGGYYNSFTTPVLNASGQVAFQGNLAGGTSTSGIFVGVAGSMRPAALEGTSAPAGGKYKSFGSPVLNSAGQLAFVAGLSGSASTTGIFAGAPGSLQTVALNGTAAPADGRYFGTYNGLGSGPLLNASGQVAFWALLTAGTSPKGIFMGTPGAVRPVALVNAPAPAIVGDNGYTAIGGVSALNSLGQVAFTAGMTFLDAQLAGVPQGLKPFALSGTTAPTGGEFFVNSFYPPTLNDAGQMAFFAYMNAGNSSGIFTGSPGSLQAAAVQGAATPAGGDAKYVSFGSVALNATGQVAFSARLSGTTTLGGVFVGTPGAMQAVALQNSAAPGDIGIRYSSFGNVVINAAGRVAFTAQLDGSEGITGKNNAALYTDLT